VDDDVITIYNDVRVTSLVEEEERRKKKRRKNPGTRKNEKEKSCISMR